VSTIEIVRQDLDQILWEDLVLEKNKEGSSEIAFSLNGKDSILEFDKGNLTKLIPALLVFLACGGAFLIIFFLKKQGKKRHGSSVNFK
jgi:hypothetical protein